MHNQGASQFSLLGTLMVISALSKAELLALLAAARAGRERDWLLFCISYNHALRVSEAVGLKVDDITEHGIRIVALKGGERVTQPLIAHPEPLLNERDALLAFRLTKRGKQTLFGIGRRQAHYLMQKYGALANLPEHKRHPHVLRHTCGSDLIEKTEINKVQAWMRHKNMGSTGVYLRPSQEQVNAAVLAALGAEIPPAG